MPGICEQAALRAPEWAALWWFGQRSVKTEAEAEEEKIPF
jgi:hypothetical protein